MFAASISTVRRAIRHPFRAGALLAGSAAFALALGCPASARAQFPEAPTVPQSMLDSPALKPPAGSNVAIVEFDDQECPACAAANPTLMAAAKKYHVPWIRHDFLIPGHVWSPQAAVNARYFESKNKELGADYRNQVFAAQQSIATRGDLNDFTQKFAQQHGIQMPFVVDPQGKFMDEIHADVDLAHALGLNRTPTIFVVTAHSHDPGHPFVQFLDPSMLYTYLDQAMSATSARVATPVKHNRTPAHN
jgi:protein-disulfide isomerase